MGGGGERSGRLRRQLAHDIPQRGGALQRRLESDQVAGCGRALQHFAGEALQVGQLAEGDGELEAQRRVVDESRHGVLPRAQGSKP